MKSNLARAALFIALLCLCLAIPRAAAKQMAKVRTFNIHDGIPSNYVTQIAQAPSGLVWIATWNGISFYDGYRFVNFRDESGRLSSNRIFQIYPAEHGIIWLLSYDKLPFYLDTSSGEYHPLSDLGVESFVAQRIFTAGDAAWVVGSDKSVRVQGLGLEGRPEVLVDSCGIRRVQADSQGREWLYCSDMLRLNGSDVRIPGKFAQLVEMDGHTYHISHGASVHTDTCTTPAASFPGVKGVYSAIAHNGSILLAANTGILRYVPEKGTISEVDPHVLKAELHTDSLGRVWAIDSEGDVFVADDAYSFRRLDTRASEQSATRTSHNIFLTDRFGTVWVGAKDRPIAYYDEHADELVPYPIVSRMLNNTAIPQVVISLIDRQNNLWVSSMHNVSLINFCDQNIREVHLKDDTETRSVCRAADGTVWMGTTDGTLGRFDSEGHLVDYLSISGGRIIHSPVPVKFAERIYTLHTDRHANVFVGTKGQGLYVVAPDGTVSNYRPDGTPQSLPDSNIYDIDEDANGNIWIGCYGAGVALLEDADNAPGLRRFHTPEHGLDGYPREFRKVRRITHTPSGVMIASTTDGLVTFDSRHTSPSVIRFHTTRHDPDDRESIHSSHVMHTLATSDGQVYVAPLGECVQRVADSDLLHDQLHFLPLSDNQAIHPFLRSSTKAGNVISMLEGRNGMIYIVFESCVVAYSPTTGHATSIGYNDFDNLIEFTEATAMCDPSTGYIWAPSARGAFVIDPAKITRSSFVPDIVVTHSLSGYDEATVLTGERITIPAGSNSVLLQFAALDYSGNELIQYSYRLDDDEQPVYLGSTNNVSLTGLSPGLHTLYIQSTNGDGAWTDNSRAVEIYVTPTFWQSTPGTILVVALVLCLVAAVLYGLYVWKYKPIANLVAQRTLKQQTIFTEISTNIASTKEEDAGTTPSDSAPLSTADRKMLQKLTAYIEGHIGDEDLRVEALADAMGMSRTVFFAKIKNLVGMSPSDFVKRLRMQKARELVASTDRTFAEIAYAVGFSDPKYFTKCFKKEIGMTPKEYRAMH